ncbi:MAG: DUF1080 domain-containing protein, partial [Lentisphaeria bacterium]|nr:DUF1080 domain-containing protein [Lentisphaeria bacterium]
MKNRINEADFGQEKANMNIFNAFVGLNSAIFRYFAAEIAKSGKLLALIFSYCLVLNTSAADFKAKIDDIVTTKIVSAKIISGKFTPGMLCVVRDGKKIKAKLKVRTATGVCRILSGKVKLGDILLEYKDDAAITSKTGEGKAPQLVKQKVPEGLLGKLLELEGAYLYLDAIYKSYSQNEKKKLSKEYGKIDLRVNQLRQAEYAFQFPELKDRVYLSLILADKKGLAENLNIKVDETALNLQPIIPEEFLSIANPPGEIEFIETDPAFWAMPQYWGRPPANADFSDIIIKEAQISIGQSTQALVRKDIEIDDAEISGEVKLNDGIFAYVILRSDIIVKFYHSKSPYSVSAKYGYNNLGRDSEKSSHTQLFDAKRWYPFKIRLKGKKLDVWVNGKKRLDTQILIKKQSGKALKSSGHFGLGTYRESAAFRKMKLTALSALAKRKLPL